MVIFTVHFAIFFVYFTFHFYLRCVIMFTIYTTKIKQQFKLARPLI